MKQNDFGLPLGFEMALAKNENAFTTFAALPVDDKQKFVSMAKNASSKSEMEEIVNRINNLQ